MHAPTKCTICTFYSIILLRKYFTRDDMSEVNKDNTFAFIALYLLSSGIFRFYFNDNIFQINLIHLND